jgi:hypothetical protein
MGGAAGDLAESKGSGKSALGRAVSATAAGVAAPVKSTLTAMKDRVMWGEGGSPNGQSRYRASIGDESLRKNEGLIGKFNTGKYSSPRYRQQDALKRAPGNKAAGGQKQDSQNGSQKNDSTNQQKGNEEQQKGTV